MHIAFIPQVYRSRGNIENCRKFGETMITVHSKIDIDINIRWTNIPIKSTDYNLNKTLR